MALRGKIVYFVRLNLLHDVHQTTRVRKVSVMEYELSSFSMGILIKMIDTIRVKERSSPFDAMNMVSLVKEKFGKIGTILPRNACDERCSFFQFLSLECLR